MIRKYIALVPFLAAFALCFCFPARAEAGFLRNMLMQRQAQTDNAQDPAGYTAPQPGYRNLAYGPDPKQALDVYVPPQAKNAPILVMVHGGGWRRGDKARVAGDKAVHYMGKGFIFVSVNYRLLPTPPDQQARDVASAMAYIEQNAQKWGGNPDKIILMGHSAGAQLVALLSAHPAGWAATGVKPWRGTVVLDSAANDLEQVMNRRHARLYDDAFGSDPAYWAQNSPTAQLAADALPMLLACSTTRKDNPCANAQNLADRAKTFGKTYALLPEAKTHGQMNKDVGQDPAYTAAIDQFIGKCLE